MSRSRLAIVIASAAIVGSFTLSQLPASAGSATFGAFSCAGGSVFTRATANYDITHSVWRDTAHYSSVDRSTSATPRPSTWYSGIAVTTRASIVNPDVLKNPQRNCAD